MFTVEAMEGSPSSALEDPNTLLLTEEAARRYFGADPNIVGRTLKQNDGKEWRIGGIIKKWPEQSHLQFEFLASLKNWSRLERLKDNWGSAACLTYFTLKNEKMR